MNNDFIDDKFTFGYNQEFKYNTTRREWHHAYKEELVDLYDIMVKNILSKNPKLKINHEAAFHNFSRLIFHGSSRRISEYTKALCQDT